MNIQKELTDWLKTLKGWQTELAYRILSKEIEESDILDIITIIKSNASFVDKEFPNFVDSVSDKQLKLLSIESIQNIESLAPRNPLKFDKDKNLVVIYGSNGSGKSGYTKIIKRISGKPRARNLKPNVFNNKSVESRCAIKYSVDNVEYSRNWKITDTAIPDLSNIDVFDTNTGNGYIEEASSTTYIPKCMTLFEALSHYYSVIGQRLEHAKSLLTKTLPNIPNEYLTTESARLYNNLRKDYTEHQIANILSWSEADEQSKSQIEKRSKEKDPGKSAIEKRKRKAEVDKIIKEVSDAYSFVNSDAIRTINTLKNEAISKRKIAKESAQIIAGKSEFQGIGSQVWKSLWEAAGAFSIQEAYKNDSYPNVNEGARCVFCHQLLDKDAKERLYSFDTFVKSKLENEATSAAKIYADKIKMLPVTINRDILSSKCNAANLNDEWVEYLTKIWEQIGNVSNSIKNNVKVSVDEKFIIDNVSILKSISIQYENEALQYDADAKQFDRNNAEKELLELKSRRWCSEQKVHILNEITRLKKVAVYDNLIAQCNTRSITIKANAISETVITEEYVKRFNNELLALKANKIKVELVKERASKGTIIHSLKLQGTNGYRPADVLSEGEHRIIALASFLADVTGGNNVNPFVFDDPISSLDQQYEEKTVERLIELSKTRQVIVFTHRLSLLGQLNEKCDSNAIQIIGIRTENWGAGEVGDTPLFAKNTLKALNFIKSDKISKAKKIFNEQGSSDYYPHGKMLCSDIRILIERIVECDFLADVIQRYRRAVNTMGKVDKLAKITKTDCDLVNDFMTRYSYYEHSQPGETPVEIPEPSIIEIDVDRLIAWLTEFNKRA